MHGNTSNEFPALSPVGGIVLTEAGLDGDALIEIPAVERRRTRRPLFF